MGETYPDLGRLGVCLINYGGDNGETIQATLQRKEEISVGAGRSRGDCAVLHRDLD